MNTKKILLIGAGIGQINLARKIKKRGYKLIVIAYNSVPEVLDIADKFIQQDLYDYDAVLSLAKGEDVDAVISDQHDIICPLVAFVAEKLGLPGNTLHQVQSYCNKNYYRDNCDRLGIPVPIHCAVKSESIPESMKLVPFPWVVKPADSQSSVGVTKVNNEEEYFNAIKLALNSSRSGSAIVEEFFAGREIVAEGFIYDGKYYNISFADRKYFELKDMFIPSQTLFPSNIPAPLLNMVNEYECKMADYIKPHFAIVHSEYLVRPETNEIRVVESALRGGGVFISSHLMPACSGIDINDLLLDCALGEKVDVDKVFLNKAENASGYICYYLPKGRVEDIIGKDAIINNPQVIKADLDNVHIGMESPKLTHKGQRLGPILLRADDRAELEQLINQIKSDFHIVVKSDNNMVNDIIWE